MPIKPPNLDDRKYADIVREARALIPQYCPEWTNLGDADPGMTLVQLFAWMTEMTIFRLNRIPDKTYIHFLNFIGEERRHAQPASAPITFQIRQDNVDVVEIPANTRISTRQKEGAEALHFLTTDRVTVHRAAVQRMVAVRAGRRPMVRELPFDVHPSRRQALLLGGGAGVQVFKLDPEEHGPTSYTPQQWLYVAHDDFGLMGTPESGGGRIQVRTAGENSLPIASMFAWEYFTGKPEMPWARVPLEAAEREVLGLPEVTLKGELPGITAIASLGHDDDPVAMPAAFDKEKFWLRAAVDYERWFAERMQQDLEIAWQDDRGGEPRALRNWEVRSAGRYLELFIQDIPPIRSGWMVRLSMVNRSLPAGERGRYFPLYRWYYRRGLEWEQIPASRVRIQGTSFLLTGPFTDMATDGYNLRAERIEAVNLAGVLDQLAVDMTWQRPVRVSLAWGPDATAAVPLPRHELPGTPFQPITTAPPLVGMKLFIGTDLLDNRAAKPVLIELDIGFESNGKPIPDPTENYTMQLAYRAWDSWRVVTADGDPYAQFALADIDRMAPRDASRRVVRIRVDQSQLRDLQRADVAGQETCWLRLELTRSALQSEAQFKKEGDHYKTAPPEVISIKLHAVRVGLVHADGSEDLDSRTYDQPLLGARTAVLEHRAANRRLTRLLARIGNRLDETRPFDPYIDLGEELADGGSDEHHALYLQLDRPLPPANRHAISFRTRGESHLPEGFVARWEILEDAGYGRTRWVRLPGLGDDAEGEVFGLQKTSPLEFRYPKPVQPSAAGAWIRGIFRVPDAGTFPALPPLSHVMLNTVEALNLHTFRLEKFSGMGVPHQAIKLRHFPLFLADRESPWSRFVASEAFEDMRVVVTEEDGVRREWRRAPGNTLLDAGPQDRTFVVDPVEGTLTFGNGIRGRIPPVGDFNIAVEIYHTVPGEAGNVAVGDVVLTEGYGDQVDGTNLLPANGGRNAESIEEIIRRAPAVLTSRDRAVTRTDFEIIAREASAEVARAACDGRLTDDGTIGVVVLPKRRDGETRPDPFLSEGLKKHVQDYLGRRCLVNVQPVVRLARFLDVDISVRVRLRPNANLILAREKATMWVRRFVDPYEGGLDGQGWTFGGTLYAQDFGRMVVDLPEVRHVMEVKLYPLGGDARGRHGWEIGQGVDVLGVGDADLFFPREIRVLTEEVEG